MPLINLRTDLKSLRYGKDVPGGGYSGQPFIQVSKRNSFDLPVAELGQSGFGTDFLLRGGTLSITNSAKDVSRILKLFTKTSTGITFTGKQNLLALTGQNYSAGGPPLVFRGNRRPGFNSEGIYLPTSTLLQVGINAFGLHGNKQGVNPFPIEANVLGFNLNTGGRPTYLGYMSTAVDSTLNKLVYLSETAPFNVSGTLFSYQGGPNSDLGLSGKTNIKFATSLVPSGARTGLANPLRISDPDKFTGKYSPEFIPGTYLKLVGTSDNPGASGKYFNVILKALEATNGSSLTGRFNAYNNEGQRLTSNNVYTQGNTFPDVDRNVVTNNGAATLTQTQLINKNPVSKGGSFSDFRREIFDSKELGVEKVNAAKQSGMLTDAPDYSNPAIRIEQRVNLGNPGAPANRSNYTVGIQTHAGGALDSLNALYLYRSDNVTNDSRKNDLVKFRIAIIDPDQPNSKIFTHFRAFINGISDSYGADWSSYKYLGRGEEFFNYTGFNRTFSINWKVVAQSRQELSVMYQKLNYLASSLTPNFSSQGFMRGNIAQLSIGGYFYEQPGIITSLTYTIPDDSTWEIGIPATPDQGTSPQGGPDFSDSSVKELSHMIDVSMTFKPIHKFLPQVVGSALTQAQNAGGIDGGDNIKQRYINLADSSEANNLYKDGINNKYRPNG
jgi:hypothetical protein